MQATWANPKHAAGPGDTSFFQVWSSTKHCAHHQEHHVISHQSRTCRTLHNGARSSIHQNHTWKIRAQTTPHATPNWHNAMADAVINGKVQPKQTKAMDMRFHWLRDRECQEQFRIYWRPGKMNYAYYWTKHHPESHHRNMRKEFLTPTIVLEMIRIEQKTTTICSSRSIKWH